ncbi:MAG: glutamyl-tRNA reductase [Sphingobacteriaceae bacterium]
MKNLKVIAFTHQLIDLKELGNLVISEESLQTTLQHLKDQLAIQEIFYIGTCNRVEFVFTHTEAISKPFLEQFLATLGVSSDMLQRSDFLDQVAVFEDMDALRHLFRVSCSLESLVVGEKEILAQLRQSYEKCRSIGFTADYLRLIMDQVVKAAKAVYTHTQIACHPISVVSLAYRKLREVNTFENARILLVGAGETNQNIAKYLQKHKYSNFVVFNRTLAKAKTLAAELNGEAFALSELKNYKKGFDILVTCTSATEPIITTEVYQSLLNGETDKKVIVDLAIPNDTASEVLANFPVHFIEVHGLQELAEKNKQGRYGELVHAERIIEEHVEEFIPILKQRRVEIAMRQVPERIKEIKETALNAVFAEDLQNLDENSREVLEKVIAYMEKKYISVPMVMAKEILVDNC